MPFNWLMLAHFKNPKERSRCLQHIEGTTVSKGVTVHVAMFGPYINSQVLLAKVTERGVEYLGQMNYTKQGTRYYNKFLPKVKYLVKDLKDRGIKIHGVDIYSHSAGILLGSWYETKYFLTTPDLVDHVLQPLKPKVVIFDSCYMGVISALYEISRVKSIKWVMASPAYHPSYSVLETEAFGKVGTAGHDKATLGRQLKAISCAFQKLTYPSYRCFIMIDIQLIPKLVNVLSKLKDEDFSFNGSTQLSRADKDTHDLYKGVKNDQLKKMIRQISKETCGLHHCKTIRGISIEVRFPDSHRGLYRTTKWYEKMKHFYDKL